MSDKIDRAAESAPPFWLLAFIIITGIFTGMQKMNALKNWFNWLRYQVSILTDCEQFSEIGLTIFMKVYLIVYTGKTSLHVFLIPIHNLVSSVLLRANSRVSIA